jgi:hypothetical protein
MFDTVSDLGEGDDDADPVLCKLVGLPPIPFRADRKDADHLPSQAGPDVTPSP